MEQKINHLLADLVVEYHKLQNFHWYVKGADFFNVHAKLEEYYNGFLDMIDETAEKLLMSGGKPLASLKEFLEESSIKEAPAEFIGSESIFAEVKKDFQMILAEAKEIKKEADEKEDYMFSSLMDDYISHFGKAVWMLDQREA